MDCCFLQLYLDLKDIILSNVYFTDIMSIFLKKISLFGNALCGAFIYFSYAVCLFGGLGVSQ